MNIRSKVDAKKWTEEFGLFAPYDTSGNKHYMVFKDQKRGGEWTLMKYSGTDLWTLHGKGETYCDAEEQMLQPAELLTFIWTNRKSVNESMKKQAVLTATV